MARLVLIRKEGKPGKYSPICLLNTAGKLVEHQLVGRLRRQLDETGGLAKNQYGFRRCSSTIGAISQVLRVAEDPRRATWRPACYARRTKRL